MGRIGGVIVRHKGIDYMCEILPTLKIKCGKCHRGNIVPEDGWACRVCGARVLQVLDSSCAYLMPNDMVWGLC